MAAATEVQPQLVDDVLELEWMFEAPPALVFKLWGEREHLLRWWGPRGYRLSRCEIDFRVGGAWSIAMSTGPGHAHPVHGVYREIVPNQRLSFTYINDYDQHEMLVTLDFAERDGGTLMRFRQAPFKDVAERDGHGVGWSSTLGLLADYVRGFQATGVWVSPHEMTQD